jgi:hypothetical protein
MTRRKTDESTDAGLLRYLLVDAMEKNRARATEVALRQRLGDAIKRLKGAR